MSILMNHLLNASISPRSHPIFTSMPLSRFVSVMGSKTVSAPDPDEKFIRSPWEPGSLEHIFALITWNQLAHGHRLNRGHKPVGCTELIWHISLFYCPCPLHNCMAISQKPLILLHLILNIFCVSAVLTSHAAFWVCQQQQIGIRSTSWPSVIVKTLTFQ